VTGPTEKPHQLAGAQLLLVDARTALLLADHARKRALMRAFGVSPEYANALTVAGLVLVAKSMHETVGPLLRRSAPRSGDALIGAGAARAMLGAIAGPTIDEMPGIGALIALALVAHGARPTLTRSARALRAGSRQVSSELHHLSDYLLGR
jgi:hypothetical protein